MKKATSMLHSDCCCGGGGAWGTEDACIPCPSYGNSININ